MEAETTFYFIYTRPIDGDDEGRVFIPKSLPTSGIFGALIKFSSTWYLMTHCTESGGELVLSYKGNIRA